MASEPVFVPRELRDSLYAFPQGMNAGIAPILLPKTQLSFLTNGTCRGDFPYHRPPYRKINLSFLAGLDPAVFTRILFQGAGYMHPYSGSDCLMLSAAGRLFQIIPDAIGNATVTEQTIAADANPATQPQVWMWQAEKWLIINDGVSNPIFFDGTTSKRSAPAGNNLTAKNLDDPNTGSMLAAGLQITIVGSPSVMSFSNTPVAGQPVSGASFPAGAAADSITIKCRANCGNTFNSPANGTQVVIGSDVWVVIATEGFSGGSPTFARMAIRNVTAIAAGVTYTPATTIFNCTSSGDVISSAVLPAAGSGTPFNILASASYVGAFPGTVLIGGFNFQITAATASPQAQLPPGRMGAYVAGRNWICMPDGVTFVGSDIVGDSASTPAGTAPLYLESVLNMSQNAQIASGGAFTVPASLGPITAMVGTPTLDASLGQGPLEVFTATQVFSVNAPADRADWIKITYPIQSVSLLGAGATGQWSTTSANNDTLFRSLDGIRSLILARRDFNVWGNVPYSEEVEPIIVADNVALLNFSSSIVFDNRGIWTANPVQTPYGVYHNRLISLNFDPVSSLAGKTPSIYDGVWTGINVLQLVTGVFSGTQRGFAFVLNINTNEIELWEIQLTPPDPDFLPQDELPQAIAAVQNFDNGVDAIPMSMIFPPIFGQEASPKREYLRLDNGEIYVDHFTGTATFEMWYKPDDYPFWTLWLKWSETASPQAVGFPQFKPRMGLGTPSGTPCDGTTNRPLREGYSFQLKLIVTGNARFKGGRFSAITIPQPKYASMNCDPIKAPSP
jgi:hypothetical protein